MAMEFCEKCGAIIIIQDDKALCPSCGFKPKKKPQIKATEMIAKQEAIAIIKEKDEATQPLVDMKCPKCKNNKAYFWTMQTRSSDESETKFYRCAKCNHTWRKYR